MLQYRVLRAFKMAGLNDQRTRGALLHALRHTYAIELATSNVSVCALPRVCVAPTKLTEQGGSGASQYGVCEGVPWADIVRFAIVSWCSTGASCCVG
jgi:hypothetical protein